MTSDITHVFFDIGGVLGSNGWDGEQRAQAVRRFGLDDEFEARHAELVGELEVGRMTLDEYLDSTVFFTPRSFSRDEFIRFMLEQSQPFTSSLALVARLHAAGRARLFTLNNEGEALNQHRISAFGLRDYFEGFLSSCWLGARKPSRLIFERALGIAQASASRSLFVDDRAQNLQPAASLAFQVHHYRDPASLAACLNEHSLL